MKTQMYTLSLPNIDNFLHIIADSDTKQALVVDPAWNAEAILSEIDKHGLRLSGILLTHSHGDHISAVHPILAKHNVAVYISEAEYRVGRIELDAPTFIADGDEIQLGNTVIRVVSTPGHTAGGVCYQSDDALIVGDTLFINGCGRCDFSDSDVNKMFDSLQRLKTLNDDLIIYCGHNYGTQKTDTLGQQKQTNPYLLINERAFFVAFRMQLQGQYRRIPFAPSSAAEMQTIYENHAPFIL